ncbi:MAG: HDIG domain-containing metalloprotein [Flavobacteriaceae bacterium]
MNQLLRLFYNNQSNIYKALLFAFSTLFIVYLIPINNQFNYDFTKGDTWGYESLYAPFDFAIIKRQSEIEAEKLRLRKEAIVYFDADNSVAEKVQAAYAQNFKNYFPFRESSSRYKRYFNYGADLLTLFYDRGVLPVNYSHQGEQTAAIIKGRSETDLPFSSLVNLNQLTSYLNLTLEKEFKEYDKAFYQLFFDILEPNLTYNSTFSEQSLLEVYTKISATRDLVRKGDQIILSNELIDDAKWDKLNSLKQQFSSENLTTNNLIWILSGYAIIIMLLLLILFLFIFQYRPQVYENNTAVTFILFNLLFMTGISISLVKFDATYLYALPICIFPLITKAFFDPRLGLFVHVLSVLLIGFIAPNSFEYVVLQTLAGIVTILSAAELYKRANLFISVFQITLVYVLGYFSFYIIRNGSLTDINYTFFGLFFINGLLTLFVQPLIYFYEKVFNLVSDVSLLELSDTNSGVFKELSNKAPGTFHHSLQVANLAEAAASAIDANVLLTRVGALYHDIGKVNKPTFFSENQRGSVSPHDDLSPKESAKIIIDHVIDGIELAKKNNLPDRVIDFIRTHHGTSKVYYFYKKQQELSKEVDVNDFTYKGPKPFSKETAIVMMADGVEAASKSLRNPDADQIKMFVERIITTQMEQKQFHESNITLSEIEMVKEVLFKKLINIYQLRVEYPE